MHAEIHGADEPAPGSTVEGRYANLFQVGHNSFEFILDCGQYFSDRNVEVFHTRIITSPKHAKDLLAVLTEAVQQYEDRFGSIATEESP